MSTVLSALAITQFRAQIFAEGLVFTSINFSSALVGGYVLVGLLVMLTILSWSSFSKNLLKWLRSLQGFLNRLGRVSGLLFVGLLAMFPLLALGYYGRFLYGTFSRLFLFWALTIIGAALLAAWRKKDWLSNLPAAALLLATAYLVSTFFNQVTDFPFSLGWSEVSRYYQASFYFSEKVYGVKLPLPVTHPSRYLLQSLPFLFSTSTLVVHRFWQALLGVAMPLFTGWALAWRLKIHKTNIAVFFIAWVYLYLMQGAVFYHLLPCVFIVLLGFDARKPMRSFAVVALASIWAGISRVNWLPLPAALAALLYLLEMRAPRGKTLSFRYLWQPAFHFIGGTLVALGSYWFYIQNSGVRDTGQFGSPFTSALLWERLLPNAAFPPGVLLGLMLISAPLVILIWRHRQRKGATLDLWRGLGTIAILLVFLFGGLTVSVKIGGGTNLHNLDAFMVLLLVTTATIVFGSYKLASTPKAKKAFVLPWTLLAFLLTVPVLFAVLSGTPLDLSDRQIADEALAQIQIMADEALAQGGQVLFISQRHLLTFHLVEGVPLVHEYEKLFLMEMAISQNEDYLSRFAADIDEQRFTLIVTDPLNRNIVDDEEDALAEENNAWVRFVARPILCAYDPVITYPELGIQLLVPLYGNKCDQ
ncbi:MAG: hypothetical protein WEC37_00600 [Anaerolineales bacterium]